MRYLLDTHIIIWLLERSPHLPLGMKEIIIDDANSIYVGSVSLWEIAIKVNLGKLKLRSTFEKFLDEVNSSDLEVLQIKDEYLKELSSLPSIHKDPFDRLLISMAMFDNLTLITADENIHKYDVPWIW